jgi:ABC-type Zn uptake system ZnuABC Zn-binding protein ZnuA
MGLVLRFVLAAALLGSVALATSCGEGDDGAGADQALRVVATTTQAADLARNVAGDRAHVVGLLTANADPHEYELRPRDVQALSDADLVVRSGGDVDDWLADAIEQAASKAPVVTLIDAMETIEGGHEHEGEEHKGEEHAEEGGEHAEEGEQHEGEEAVDAHWWQNPHDAVIAIGEIERSLAIVDPEHADAYRDSAGRYRAEIETLDRAIRSCWNDVPPRQRKLVTTHDALSYYAQRYGLEVVGTVIPSASTEGQASAGALAELVETIRREDVKVVFAESSVNSKVERAIADETGATVGKPLWADTLGPTGSDGATYLTSIASNTQAMVDGVTGGQVTCALRPAAPR